MSMYGCAVGLSLITRHTVGITRGEFRYPLVINSKHIELSIETWHQNMLKCMNHVRSMRPGEGHQRKSFQEVGYLYCFQKRTS